MSSSGCTLKTLALIALSSWSCSSTAVAPTPQVAAIVVSPATSTLAVDAQLPLQAMVRDGSGGLVADAPVTWTVQDPAIVSVSTAGVVHALAVGTSQVAANAHGKSGIAIVTVSGAAPQAPADPGNGDPGAGSPSGGTPAAVAHVLVKAPSKNLVVGSTMQLTATAMDDKGNTVPNQTFRWSSSDTNRATVSASGVVTGKRQGHVSISAQISSSGGKSGSVDLEVKKK
jgi:uncharacterized protein YjdB